MSDRMIIDLKGPQACGKTILAKRLIQMLMDGPANHFPVTILDGEVAYDIDRKIVKERQQ